MPDWKAEIRPWLADLHLAPMREAAIVEELAQYIEDYYAELLAGGACEAEAYEQARAELRGGEFLTRELRRMERQVPQEPIVLGTNRRTNTLADLWQDLRYGARMLMKNPGFTMVAVITLALGIGANTAIFSVVNAVLLRPLPYPEPGRLTQARETDLGRGGMDVAASMPDYREWRKRNQSFSHLAAYFTNNYNISGDEEPEQVVGARVDTDFFTLLGVNPAQGRGFSGEEGVFGKHRVVVLSDALWRRRFGDGARLDGQTIRLSGESFTVIGVAPRGFRFPANDVALWTPLALADNDPFNTRGVYWLNVIGRLKAGVTPEQAQNDLVNIHRQLDREKITSGHSARVEALAEATVGNARRTLWVLLGAVGCILLIACVNVANLLLARASARASEMAVRAAIGAGRSRLVRQLLTESLLIGLLGAVAGLAMAWWGVEALLRLEPDLPRFDTVKVDGRALGFTLGLALGASLLFGLLPALRSSGAGLSAAIKGGGRGGTRNHRLLGGLVVAEIAIAMVLLAGAGLMINSLLRLQRVDPGYETEKILTMRLALPVAKYPTSRPEQIVGFYRQLAERVKALPGALNAGVTTALPLAGGGVGRLFTREDRPAPKSMSEIPVTQTRLVSADYFDTLGMRLVNGRFLSERDAPNGLPVAVINETAANRFWPGENPIGKVFKLGPPEEMLQAGIRPPGFRFIRWTVVGVVKDVKQQGLSQPSGPEIYTLPQQGRADEGGAPLVMYLAVRALNNPTALTVAIRRQTQELDKEQPIADVATMEERRVDSLLRTRFNTLLLTIFAAVALTLAVVGVYGVMSYSLAERTREIGVRVALGAQRRDVIALIVKRGMAVALSGALIGLCGAIAVTRLMTGLLYEVSATDPLTLSVVMGVLVAAAALACYLPARRAMKVDPMIALRSE
jgi:putative ABC transport system permease protein